MKTRRIRHTSTSDRSGVALILTIGILALLLVLAFSFAVSMQIEKKAAGASADGFQARQSIMQTITRAAGDLRRQRLSAFKQPGEGSNEDSYRIPYPPRTASTLEVRRGEITPRDSSGFWIPFGMYASNPGDTASITNFADSVVPYTPRILQEDIFRWITNNGVHWKTAFLISSDISGYEDYDCDIPKAVRPFSYAPIVFNAFTINCSGFLDPHIVGRTDRSNGLSAAEIQIDNLPESDAIINKIKTALDTIQADNTTTEPPDGPAESIPELETIVGGACTNFFIWSHAPSGKYLKAGDLPRESIEETDLASCANIHGSDSASWSSKAEILDAFANAGFDDATTQEILYTNLLDYVDVDDIPKNKGHGISQEANPGINEFRIASKYTCTRNDIGTNKVYRFSVTNTIDIEYAQPFLNAPSNTYTLKVRLQQKNDQPSNLGNPPIANLTFGNIRFDPCTFFVTNVIKSFKDGPNRNETQVTDDLTYIGTMDIGLGTIQGQTADFVDQLKNTPSPAFSVSFTNKLPNPPAANGEKVEQTVYIDIECLDSRCNYDMKDTNQWRIVRHTNGVDGTSIGNTNLWTLWAATNADYCGDADTLSYCGNHALGTVGELGFLVYAPMRTIRLIDHPKNNGTNGMLHRVLDTFTLTTNQANTVMYGAVNPNTEYAEPLACVFDKMQLETVPGARNRQIAWTDALRIAQAITNYTAGTYDYYYDRTTNWLEIPNFMWNVSDLGHALVNVTNVLGTTDPVPECMAESLLRNSSGLFSTRQLMFTIVAAASYILNLDAFGASSGGLGGSAEYYVNENAIRTAERRAVAIVFVDAWTGETVLRTYKFLEN